MDDVLFQLLALIALALSCCAQLRLLRLERASEAIVAGFGLATANVVLWGYALSALSLLNDLRAWAALAMAWAVLSLVLTQVRGVKPPPARPDAHPASPRLAALKSWYQEASILERLLLIVPVLTVAVVGVLNLIVILSSAPGNWDSMTFRLARVGYYLQRGNTSILDPNFWAQELHPRNSPLLLVFAYLAAGRNENLMQLVQYFAYWAAVCSLYAICMRLHINRAGSVFAAAVGGLLVEWLMEATTTQNDLILTAHAGAACCFLLAFRETHARKYLALAAFSAALAAGAKSTFLMSLPSLALVAAYVLWQSGDTLRGRARHLAYLTGVSLLAGAAFVLPAGYLNNYLTSGNPLGPSSVRETYAYEESSLPYIARHGTLNLIRYGFDFLSLDGMPPVRAVRGAQTAMRWLPTRLVEQLGLDVEADDGAQSSFELRKLPIADEDYSFWGVLGPALVWIAVLVAIAGGIRSPAIRLFSLGALIIVLAYSYVGPYDPWRGRYFSTVAVFAIPAVGKSLRARRRWIRIGLLPVICLGCLSALTAVVFRDDGALVSMQADGISTTSLFTMDRTAQLARNAPFMERPLRKFERLVPANAAVALALPDNSYEYPLFGPGLTRTLLPINSYVKGLQPIPSEADYLLYAEAVFPCSDASDTYLGHDWYLRTLTDANRLCP